MPDIATLDIPTLGVRWIHILSAITAVGGLFFLRFVLLPAARDTLDDETHAKLREAVMKRWKKVVMVVIGLLFLTGLYNLMVVGMPKVKEHPSYPMIFGIKFLAALGVFFLASVLAGSAKVFDGLRARAPLWMSIAALLAVVVVVLSGVLGQMR